MQAALKFPEEIKAISNIISTEFQFAQFPFVSEINLLDYKTSWAGLSEDLQHE